MINSPHRTLAAGVAVAVTTGLALTLAPPPAVAAPARCRPIQTNDQSWPAGISADGRYAAFRSAAPDLVPGGSGTSQAGSVDVFVRDLRNNTTVRASVAGGGAQGNADSDSALISGQGRFVIFGSAASNLVPGDSNGTGDVFVRDLRAGTTVRVSVG